MCFEQCYTIVYRALTAYVCEPTVIYHRYRCLKCYTATSFSVEREYVKRLFHTCCMEFINRYNTTHEHKIYRVINGLPLKTRKLSFSLSKLF